MISDEKFAVRYLCCDFFARIRVKIPPRKIFIRKKYIVRPCVSQFVAKMPLKAIFLLQ